MSTAKHIALLIGLALIVPPRFAPQIGLAEDARCTQNSFDASALRADAVEGDWRTYRNAKNGLSFRYPPSMRVEERDPLPFHFDSPPELIVDLLGDGTNRNVTVLRFNCARGQRTPEMASARARALLETHPEEDRTGRVSTGAVGTMQIDGHEAIVSCGCGRAACRWSVLTLQPRECGIVVMEPGEDPHDSLLPVHDGEFPILSIIEAVHFEH